MFRLPYHLTESLTFKDENNGFHHNQYHNTLYTYSGNTKVGYLDYTVHNGDVSIGMIKVENKRQGIATALIYKLQSMFPDTEINIGLLTDEGQKFFASLNKREIPNPLFAKYSERLKNLKAVNDAFQKKADAILAIRSFTSRDKKWFASVQDRWNKNHDKIYQLENKLRRMKPSKILFEPLNETNNVRKWIGIVEALSVDAYHGTKSPHDFDAFSLDFFGDGTTRKPGGGELPAIWAAQRPNVATMFAGADPWGRVSDRHARLIPISIHMDNQMIVDMSRDAFPNVPPFEHPMEKSGISMTPI